MELREIMENKKKNFIEYMNQHPEASILSISKHFGVAKSTAWKWSSEYKNKKDSIVVKKDDGDKESKTVVLLKEKIAFYEKIIERLIQL